MATRGVNKVILIGNLGNDPEVRYMPSGDAMAQLSLATSETWKDKQTGEQREQTEWHRLVIFRRLAEIAGEYLRKGSKIYVEGSLRTRKWQDKNGQDRYTTEIVVNEMQMLDSRSGGSAGFEPRESAPPRSQPPRESAGGGGGGGSGGGQGGGQSSPGGFDNDFDDDIPFARPQGLDGLPW